MSRGGAFGEHADGVAGEGRFRLPGDQAIEPFKQDGGSVGQAIGEAALRVGVTERVTQLPDLLPTTAAVRRW